MLSDQTNKGRFVERFFLKDENVKDHLSILEEEHRSHSEYHHSQAHSVVEQHTRYLYQKEAVANKHLHVVNCAVRDIVDNHVE